MFFSFFSHFRGGDANFSRTPVKHYKFYFLATMSDTCTFATWATVFVFPFVYNKILLREMWVFAGL